MTTRYQVTHNVVELDNGVISLELDSPNYKGAYIATRLEEDGVLTEYFNNLGEVVTSTFIRYNELMVDGEDNYEDI